MLLLDVVFNGGAAKNSFISLLRSTESKLPPMAPHVIVKNVLIEFKMPS